MPITNDPFEDVRSGLNKFQRGYELYPDPNQPDRVLVSSPTGEEINLGLKPSEFSGQTGKTWIIQSPSGRMGRVITPELTGIYNQQTGRVGYEGTSSSQNLATLIDQAFVRSKNTGTPAQSAFQGLLSLGDERLGISPAPSIPYSPGGARPAAERKIIGSVGVNTRTRTTEGERAPFPEEARAIWQNLQQNIGQAGTEGFKTTPIAGQKDAGEYPLSFERMNAARMMLSDKASLLPHIESASLAGGRAGGMWPMANDPKRSVKAPNLTAGVEKVEPYIMERGTGTVRQMEPGVTTNLQKPGYAYSNVLLTGETTPQTYERRRMVFGTHPVPGASTAYTDPQGINPSFYGREKTVSVPMKGLSLYDLASGESKINLRNINRPLGGGAPIAHLGQLERAGQEPEDIKARFGPGIYHHSSTNFVIPKYMNKVTGMPAEFTRDLALGKDSDIITTDALVEKIKKQTSMPVVQRGGTGMGLELGGYLQAGSSLKGFDIKASEYGTGAPQSMKVGGKEMGISHFTAELKGTGFTYGFMGGMNPKQMFGLMGDFARTFKGGRQFLQQFREAYGERAGSGMPMNVDLDRVAQMYTGITGGEPMTGQAFGAQVFEKTIRAAEPGSAADIRNLQRYGAGYVPEGTELSTGVWHPEQLQAMREQWARAYRQNNPDVTDEAINKAWGQTFRETTAGIPAASAEAGYRELMQVAGRGTHTYTEMLAHRRVEHRHGRSAGFEWLSGLSEQYPEFARQLGAHIETTKPQGPTQQAALGLLQYGVFQGQRRESYATGEPFQMPTNYTEVGREKLMSIGAFLQGSGAEMSSLEKLEALNKRFFKDVPEGNLLWNPETKSFLPNPGAVLGSTFKELGVEAASVARPYVHAMSQLANIVNPDNEMTPQQMADMGMEQTQGLYNYVTGMISGRGEFFKRLLSRNLPSGLGGRVAFDPSLAPNERRVPYALARSVAQGLGYRGPEINRKAREIMESGAQMVGSRYPQLSQTSMQASTAVKESEYRARIGEERAYAMNRDSRFNSQMGAPSQWAQGQVGDWDFDPYFELMGLQRNPETGNLERVSDPAVAAGQTTRASAAAEEAKYFANPMLRNLVNAQTSQLEDYAAGKDVMGGILGGNKQYSAVEAFGLGVNNMLSKTLGMGVGYNPRRGVLASMAAGGYSSQEMAGVLSTVPTFYQPALDKLLKGHEASGVPAAATIAKSYFGEDPRTGKGYLKLGSNDAIKRGNRAIPGGGGFLPEESAGGLKLQTSGMEGLTRNRMEMLKGTAFLVEQFAKGGNIKGGNARMSPEQVARWFARPGEHEQLAEKLGNDPQFWGEEVGNYYQGILGENPNLQAGLQQIYKTPMWGSVLTNASAKAINATTPGVFLTEQQKMLGETGEQVPGAEKTAKAFATEMGDDYQTNMEASIGFRNIAYRARGMNLRGMRARAIQSMVQRFPENTIVGKGSRAIARMLNVDFNRPELEFGEAEAGVRQRRQDEEARLGKYYRAAKSQGYEGDFDQFASEFRAANEEYASRSAAGITTPVGQEITPRQQHLQALNKAQSLQPGDKGYDEAINEVNSTRDTWSASIAGGRKKGGGGPINRTSPADLPPGFEGGGGGEVWGGEGGGGGGGAPPAAPPSEPPDDDDDGKPRRRYSGRMMRRGVQAATPALGFTQRQALPRDIQLLPKRVASKNMGVLTRRVRSYLENTEALAPQLDPILSELGFGRGSAGYSGDVTGISHRDVRTRLEQALVQDPTGLKSALPPKLYNQLLEMKGSEADINYLQATMDATPGFGGRRQMISALLKNPRLKEDLSIGSWFADAAGGSPSSPRVKNPYTVRGAEAMAGDQGFNAVYNAMKQQGIIGATGQFGPEEVGKIRNILSQFPGAKDILRQAGNTSTESPENLPSRVSELGQVAKAFTKTEGSGALGASKNYVMVTAQAHERLNAAIEKQAEKAKVLNEVMETGNKRLETKAQREKRLADLEVKAAESSFTKMGAQQELNQLRASLAPGETPAPGTFSRMATLQGQIARAEKAETAAEAGIGDIRGEERWGQAARRMLGGFGLMYMRSIGNFATSGWGYGMSERMAMDQQVATGQYAATGQAGIPRNQQQALQNQMALQGVGFDPRMGFQQFSASNPWARDLWTPAAAGIGAWGYSQFAASQIKGTTGEKIGKAAGAIGLGAAAFATAGDVYARMQDDNLGQRIGGSRSFGINDQLALWWQGASYSKEGRERYQQTLGEISRADKAKEFYGEGGTFADFQQQLGLSTSEAYRSTFYELQQRNLNWSPETTGQVTSFMQRTPGIRSDDERLQRIAEDYQMGGAGAQLAQGMMQAAGFNAREMYAQGPGGISALSQTQLDVTERERTPEEQALLTGGLQYATNLQGARYVQGFGARTNATVDERMQTLRQFGAIAGTAGGDIYAAQQAAWATSQKAGLTGYAQPQLTDFVTPDTSGIRSFSQQESQEMQMQAQAQQMAAQQRIQTAQNLQVRATSLGNAGLGAQMYQQVTGVAQGQEWMANRMFNADPMALAAAVAGGANLGGLEGPTTIQGNQLNANYLAMTDVAGTRLTGLNWGRTSLQLGNLSAQQMGQRLGIGQMDNAASRAAIQGQQLYQPVTLASGETVSQVGGTMGLQQYGNQLNYDYRMGQIGLQRKQMGIDFDYYQQLWGLQDQQRALGHGHQMAMFGFQEQGMALQQQGMQQQNQNWWANFGLNQRQQGMQRDWTRQDWSFNAETRGMQWGWKQEDFQEERRFMTGRQRRLAERGMERESIMHDREGEQIDKQKKRQEELWNIEDERMELQIKSHKEAYELQQKQFELQQKQFQENKSFYLENKKIQDEIIQLQRDHWLKQHENAKKQLDLSEQHAKATLELQQVTDQLQLAMELTNGELKTMADDSLLRFQGSLATLTGGVQEFIDAVGSGDWFAGIGQGSTAGVTGAGGGNHPQDIISVNTPPPQIAYMQTTNPYSTSTSGIGLNPGGGGRASGGPLSFSGVEKVGEEGEEYVVNGVVIPSALTQELKRLGVRAGSGGMQTEPSMLKNGSLGPTILSDQGRLKSDQKLSATIIVNIGPDEIERFVIDTVAKEI